MNKKFLIPLSLGLSFGVCVGLGAVAFAQDNPTTTVDVATNAADPIGMPVLKPDATVFDHLTDMQRKVTLMEKEILLEGLRNKRKQVDVEARELADKEEDRILEREQAKVEKQRELEETKAKQERDDLLKQAEEELRLAELRAQQESLLRSIEEQAKKAEVKKTEEEIILAREEARKSVRGVKQDPQPLIISPGQEPAPTGIEGQLSALAPLVGALPAGQVQQPAPQAVVEPNPVVRSVKGIGGQLHAKIILPSGGEVDVIEGDKIPGDWKIVRVDVDGVFAKRPSDKKPVRLTFGNKIDIPVAEVVSQPEQTGFSIPLASNNFPIPPGLPGAAASQRGSAGIQ